MLLVAGMNRYGGKFMMRFAALLASVLLFTGCATSQYMTRSASVEPAPAAGKALVVFMRPSTYGGAIESSLYDVSNGAQEFIGIASPRTKVAYQADPGIHLFMVVAENADFMNANLEAGKTYYVLVSPRMGVWKARFSLLPVHNDAAAKYSMKSEDFRHWQAATHFVEKSPGAADWYRASQSSITAKHISYMERWKQASPQQQAELTLLAEDGT